MNEFVAKKLGEVLAFSNIGMELFERSDSTLREAFSDVDEIKQTFQEQASNIKQFTDTSGVWETTEAKAEATGDKLRGMMETYIGDEWDNLAELLEWLGFMEGAAVVHWRVIEGAGETQNDELLQQFAADGAEFRHDLLHRVQEETKKVGAKRARG